MFCSTDLQEEPVQRWYNGGLASLACREAGSIRAREYQRSMRSALRSRSLLAWVEVFAPGTLPLWEKKP